MSKFNYNTDILDQINELDEKLVEVINVVKQLSNRLKKLEDIAATKGLLEKTSQTEGEDTCVVM